VRYFRSARVYLLLLFMAKMRGKGKQILHPRKKWKNTLHLQTTIFFENKHILIWNCTINFLMQVMYHLCSKNTIASKHYIPTLFRLNYTKMLLSPSKINRTICPDLPLVIEARKYERISLTLPFPAPPRILFGRGQSMTLSVTDVVLSPTVPSVYFPRGEN